MFIYLSRCDGKPLPVQEQKIPILANAVVDPKITISGVGLKQRTVAEFALVILWHHLQYSIAVYIM